MALARTTMQHLYRDALLAQGATVVIHTCDYLILTDPQHPGMHYFVGHVGELRWGRNRTKSVMCPPVACMAILKAHRKVA